MPSFSRWRWSGRRLLAKEVGVLVASPRVHLGILNPCCRKLRALGWRFSTSIAFPKLKVFPTCSFSGFLVKSDTNAVVSNYCPETVRLQLGGQVFIWRTFHQPPVSALPLQSELQNLNLHQACWKLKSTIHQVRTVFFWNHSNSFSQDTISLSTI